MGLKVLFLNTNDFSYTFHKDIYTIEPHQTYEGCLSAVVVENVKPGKNLITLAVSDRIAAFATAGNEVEIIVEQP